MSREPGQSVDNGKDPPDDQSGRWKEIKSGLAVRPNTQVIAEAGKTAEAKKTYADGVSQGIKDSLRELPYGRIEAFICGEFVSELSGMEKVEVITQDGLRQKIDEIMTKRSEEDRKSSLDVDSEIKKIRANEGKLEIQEVDKKIGDLIAKAKEDVLESRRLEELRMFVFREIGYVSIQAIDIVSLRNVYSSWQAVLKQMNSGIDDLKFDFKDQDGLLRSSDSIKQLYTTVWAACECAGLTSVAIFIVFDTLVTLGRLIEKTKPLIQKIKCWADYSDDEPSLEAYKPADRQQASGFVPEVKSFMVECDLEMRAPRLFNILKEAARIGDVKMQISKDQTLPALMYGSSIFGEDTFGAIEQLCAAEDDEKKRNVLRLSLGRAFDFFEGTVIVAIKGFGKNPSMGVNYHRRKITIAAYETLYGVKEAQSGPAIQFDGTAVIIKADLVRIFQNEAVASRYMDIVDMLSRRIHRKYVRRLAEKTPEDYRELISQTEKSVGLMIQSNQKDLKIGSTKEVKEKEVQNPWKGGASGNVPMPRNWQQTKKIKKTVVVPVYKRGLPFREFGEDEMINLTEIEKAAVKEFTDNMKRHFKVDKVNSELKEALGEDQFSPSVARYIRNKTEIGFRLREKVHSFIEKRADQIKSSIIAEAKSTWTSARGDEKTHIGRAFNPQNWAKHCHGVQNQMAEFEEDISQKLHEYLDAQLYRYNLEVDDLSRKIDLIFSRDPLLQKENWEVQKVDQA